MATGIVSVAAAEEGLRVLSDALLLLACVAWVALAVALAPPRGRPRLESLAIVAATAVLGARFELAGLDLLALALWGLALALWLVLLVRRPALGLPGGGSLLVVVATESLGALAALLAPHWTSQLLSVALVAWLAGLVLYPFVAGAVVRSLRRRRDFAPDLWIVMGGLAIATLAGSELLLGARTLQVLPALRRVLPDADLATWTLSSACVVPLALAELKTRHARSYHPARWSFVFPLGMYSVATRTLGRADGLRFSQDLGSVFFALAVAAWTLALVGLGRRALGRFIR
ncbi:MAG TPA: hypothetical protein VFA30_10910 [Gaiellaceae bacterium]|nr:hypothetical protein [Gaiellaceae bacterium]